MTYKHLVYTLFWACSAAAAYAQTDTTLNRNVTVERAFQPVVQTVGKVNRKPAITETEIPIHKVEFSDYNAILNPAFNTNDLLSQPTRFASPAPLHGYVRGGLGHSSTLFDFEYSLNGNNQSKRVRDVLDIYAHHNGRWGIRGSIKTNLGMRYAHTFSTCQLYFGVEGRHGYLVPYGCYFDPETEKLTISKPSELLPNHRQHICGADAFIGLKSNGKQDLQYQAQVGYTIFSVPLYANEHQLRTKLNMAYKMGDHRVGANIALTDAFISVYKTEKEDSDYAETPADSTFNPRHALRMEPYYAYTGRRFSIHVGLNLDMNIGRGQQYSVERPSPNKQDSLQRQVSFAPSPNVHFEGQIAKEWLTIYGDVKGRFGLGTFESYVEGFPFRALKSGITSHHVASYVPIDGTIGFHIKAYRDLMITLYGGYAYQKYQRSLIATVQHDCTAESQIHMPGTFVYAYSDFGRGKVGAAFHYHYQDIITVKLGGNYYFWRNLHNEKIPVDNQQFYAEEKPNTVYDRANWDISLRIDGRIDAHWSLYSDNYFEGKRLAMTTIGYKTLRPTIELNLGCQYEEKQWAVFLQLNNYIHRHNDIYYGYKSEGIHFLVGGSYKF